VSAAAAANLLNGRRHSHMLRGAMVALFLRAVMVGVGDGGHGGGACEATPMMATAASVVNGAS
jgi:hypothetical protein